MKNSTILNALYFLLFFISPLALAEPDPWYANNPSCVIDRGNPGRTGEYLAEPLEKNPVNIWGDAFNSTGIAGNPMACTKDFIISFGPTVAYKNQTKKLWWGAFDSNFAVYKDFIYVLSRGRTISVKDFVKYQILDGKKETIVKNATTDDSEGDPLIYNNVAYFGGKSLTAVDLNTKKQLWKFDVTEPTRPGPSATVCSLSTDGERIFFSDWGFNIFAVEMKTGKLLWSKDGFGLGRSYAAVMNGNLYLGQTKEHKKYEYTTEVFKIDAVTGKTVWHTPMNSRSFSSLSLAVSTEVVIVSCIDKVVGLDTKTGEILWSIFARRPTAPVLVKNIAYFVEHSRSYGDDYKATAVNKFTGKKLWSFDLPESNTEYGIMPDNKKVYISGAGSTTTVLEQQESLPKSQ